MKNKNQIILAGVDEVGRGPLAGPVVAAAVILDPNEPILNLMDSKKLSEKKREIIAESIKEKALAWSLGRADVYEIDEFNILQASLLAMKRAVDGLRIQPTHVKVDGTFCPDLTMPVEAIIKGDQKVSEISAASIIAKVNRDNEMIVLSKQYPGYGFEQHKGYPTKQHLIALKEQGVTQIHRKSFGPVKECLDELYYN